MVVLRVIDINDETNGVCIFRVPYPKVKINGIAIDRQLQFSQALKNTN